MSASTQPAEALTAEFGVRKAGLGALKEHQGNAGKGKRLEGGAKSWVSLRLQQRWE